jgi:hypothetical protein
MDGEITGENDERVGLYVDDNGGVEHWIEMEFDGEIKYHEQDGYPDKAANRTDDESEMVGQARRFARLHVYRETEYEPFPVEENLPGIKRVRDAIEALSPEEFEQYFADAYDQVLSKHPDVSPPVPRPSSVGPNDYIVYFVDVYLDEEGDIEAVSDIHLQYQDDRGEKTQKWNDDPFPDRKADARLQLFGKYIPSMEVFQEFLVYHLRCQLRDIYLGAGIEPPEEYRVLGRGIEALTGRYHNPNITVYEDYHLEEADIPGYELEFDYGFGELGRQSVIQAKRNDLSSDGNPSNADQELFDPSRDGDGGLLETVSSMLRNQDNDDSDR